MRASKAKWRALATAAAAIASCVGEGVRYLATEGDVDWVELEKREREAVEREMLALAARLQERADRMGERWKSKKKGT